MLEEFAREKFDIIVVAGQSNSAGYGLGNATEEYQPSENVLWLNDGLRPRFENEDGKDVFKIDYPSPISVTVADEPIEGDSKVGKLALFFAKQYIESGLLENGRKILILHAGVGGTGFRDNQWGMGRTLYQRVKDFARTALDLNEGNRLVAFLWHQGECDSFENAEWTSEKKYATHKKNLGDMIEDFKAEFSCLNLPFIAGGFCDEWYLKNKTQCDAVLRAIKEVCAKHGGFVETAGLKSNNEKIGNGDDIHFCREASHILGKKYFEAYMKICNKK